MRSEQRLRHMPRAADSQELAHYEKSAVECQRSDVLGSVFADGYNFSEGSYSQSTSSLQYFYLF